MKIKSIKVIDGKNKWSESKDKLIHMVLDLGEFEEKPSNKIEGFYERIKEHLPSLQSHRCSEGKAGGFFKRIKEGTWMGHIIEHVALELQTLAGMDTGWGRTRGVKGQKGVYNVVFNYVDKDKGRLAAREAFNVVNDIIDNKNPQIDNIVKKLKPKTKLQESIRKVLKEELNEVRVPRSERVELYKDDNIIVVVPLTHRALQKYAHQCQWCINDDIHEWEDYHKGKHAVIIQRNPKKPKIGITGNPTASEIFLLAKWDNNQSSFEDVCQMLDYEFRNDRTMSDYYVTISNDINNFATNIVYYSPETGIYDQEDNFLWNFNIEINDIPNVKPKVIEIMDDYLTEEE